MKKIILSLLTCGALLMSSCQTDKPVTGAERKVTLTFATKSMSDKVTRSEASAEENAISKIALYGINTDGDVEQTFPVIENPTSGSVTVSVNNTIKSIYAIANPAEGVSQPANVSAIEAMTGDFTNAPRTPFVMGGKSDVNSNTIQMELIRAIAKIDVIGKNGFTVNSVTVTNTPDEGYVFGKSPLSIPFTAQYTAYDEVQGASVYVAENGTQNPTTLLVKGTYGGQLTAYSISVTDNGEAIELKRNTCYEVSIVPISQTECSVSINIPEWDDVTGDDTMVPFFGTYMATDFHQHTGYSDGSHPIDFVLNQGKKYGLDVTVNSEHGGAFAGNASEGDQEVNCPTWIGSGVLATDIKGDVTGTGANQKMWRWQSIKDYSFQRVLAFNQNNGSTIAVQGLEWNPPGHEHASTGIITGQTDALNPNANAMAQFEYMFDLNDTDKTGGAEYGWVKSTKTGHEKSMEAAKWMQDNHRYSSWIVPAHPERQNRWQISDYRDLNDIAPDVFVAFESTPGHQASSDRGGIGNKSSFKKSYTYGGVGIQAAQVGGLWDAMLSEGRNFWLVANSDYHEHVTKGSGDFYPGEYQKTYISMKDKTPQSFVNGLRSGNIYTVHGDIINRLEFSVGYATMGQTYNAKNSTVKVRILVCDPETSNNNTYTAMTNPVLDHIDLIAGEMREKVAKGSPEYAVDTYDNVRVIARFDARGGVTDGNGITSVKWNDLGNGVKLVEYTVKVTGSTYFRLRGTNNGLNAAGKTDANGNPLEDQPTSSVEQGAKKAFEDLWFYSNPVFVKVN